MFLREENPIEYKNSMGGEQWVEAERYVLKAISGKDSVRSKEFGRLFNDIRLGKVNTILFADLDRVGRSVKDLLNFFETLSKHNVESVCLNQNYDTISPQGELIMRMVMVHAEIKNSSSPCDQF